IALATRDATTSVPVVGFLGPDPVQYGLVASLARPGSNVTGVTAGFSASTAKTLQIMTEVVPAARRVAVLWNSRNPTKLKYIQEAQEAAESYGVELISVAVHRDDEVENALAVIVSSHAQGLLVLQDPLTAAHSESIAAFATRERL